MSMNKVIASAERFTKISQEEGCLVIIPGEVFKVDGLELKNTSEHDLFLTVDAGGTLHASFTVVDGYGRLRKEKRTK